MAIPKRKVTLRDLCILCIGVMLGYFIQIKGDETFPMVTMNDYSVHYHNTYNFYNKANLPVTKAREVTTESVPLRTAAEVAANNTTQLPDDTKKSAPESNEQTETEDQNEVPPFEPDKTDSSKENEATVDEEVETQSVVIDEVLVGPPPEEITTTNGYLIPPSAGRPISIVQNVTPVENPSYSDQFQSVREDTVNDSVSSIDTGAVLVTGKLY